MKRTRIEAAMTEMVNLVGVAVTLWAIIGGILFVTAAVETNAAPQHEISAYAASAHGSYIAYGR